MLIDSLIISLNREEQGKVFLQWEVLENFPIYFGKCQNLLGDV